MSSYEINSKAKDKYQCLKCRTPLHTITTPKVRNTRAQDQIDATHGSFDNNIEVLTETLVRIKGAPLVGEMEWLDY